MKKDIQYFSNIINERIESLNIEKTPANLYDPITYILALGGKRLRPLMALLSFNLFSDETHKAVDPSIGIEIFHNFTLMHDDIMDEAPLRRGKPTIHKKWNPYIAILSGDVMLVKAYECIMSVEDHLLRRVLDAFNNCAKGVCEGQQIDMDFESMEEVEEDEYLEMIRLKTAVLLGFSMELGAIIGGADQQQALALKEFGENMGLGFQLKDDLLDVYADHQKFGKQVGGDIISNKKTFLWINAWKNADIDSKKTLESWTKKETFIPEEKVQSIKTVYDYLKVRQLSETKMDSYFNKATTILEGLEVPADRKETLQSFSKKLIARDH